MKNWKNVKIPEMMKDLQVDRRGFPAPFIVLRDKNNVPQFIMNDDTKVEECIKDNLCSICGKKMGEDMWMIGGPLSAFHPQGAYVDVPVHKECGEYALQVCPYLAVSSYNGKKTIDDIDAGNFTVDDDTKKMIFVNPTQSQDRVPFFVFNKIKGFDVQRRGIQRYIKPHRPYLEVEFWNDGEQITKEQAIKLSEQESN
jgi:hypothetical protein